MVRDSLIATDWSAQLEPALRATGVAAQRLERASTSGIAVTTGQQPGLFGGPLYTWWKALSALAMANRLEEVTGIPAVPIFWAATDDADFEEASTTVVSTGDGAEELRASPGAEIGSSLADVSLGDVSEQLRELSIAAGSAPNSSILDAVTRAYGAEQTVGSAYVQLLREILEPLGIVVLDAAHRSVRAAALPLLRDALTKSDAIETALNDRSIAFKEAALSAQVKLVNGRTLVFSDVNGKRDRIRIRDVDEALRSAGSVSLGPNVLLRPIVERSIIPTVAYMGGPAEIAYFAQVTAVSSALGVAAPLVLPRWSGFVIEPRVERILERHGLTVEDFRDPHAVETRLARAAIPEELSGRIEALTESLDNSISAIQESDGADLVAPSVLEGLKRNVGHRVSRLERRFAAGVKRRGTDALREAAIARGSLFPFAKPQERALNLIPLLARYGNEPIDAVLENAKAHAAKFA